MTDIDAVITWIDGNDPVLREKRKKYGSANLFKSDDVAGETRFNNLGEIFWCVASLNKFAPFLHKIYLVTDGQDPHLEEFMQKNFPEGHIPMEVVDHKTIFRGYEEYLPTFNSITLETMTWRIPGLSEHYIELNDDFMLSAPATPEDFFTEDGKVVCYAKKFNMFWGILTRKLKPKINGRKKVTFKGLMINGARLGKQKNYFLKLHHTPRPLRKSFFEDYFREHPEDMTRNIRHRFRNASQFTPQELQYITLDRRGECKIVSYDKKLFFLQPKKKDRPDYVPKKLERLQKRDYQFCCFNSIDLATEKDRNSIMDWIEDKLEIRFR